MFVRTSAVVGASNRKRRRRYHTTDPKLKFVELTRHSNSSSIEPELTEVKDMKKLTLLKLEKRIAPRYMPFAS
jgi:hypothetical protein